ncbi:MAG: DEAD/DEAH box helicase [Deltaproteobacteria bacterium]|nr:DEAD/DEAH box helicase [Deltaproteobacteria bacterium]
MKIILSNELKVEQAPGTLLRELRDKLTIKNPAYLDALKMGRWTGNLDEYLSFFRLREKAMILPRGFTGQLIAMTRRAGIPYQLIDNRRVLPEVDFTFAGKLRDFQGVAVAEMLKKDFGTLSAATGSGKTIMALKIIAQRRQPTLIIVHTKELLDQWVERIGTYLDIPKKEIGIIGNGKKLIGEKITVGIVNSIYPMARQIKERISHLVIDECHRTPSRTFTEAVSAFDCRYMLGLSATPWRRDGLSKLIFWHVGDVCHEVDKAALQESGDILKAEVISRETDFLPWCDPSTEYSKMLSELCNDPGRNTLICKDIIKEASNGSGIILALSDRKSHCDTLGAMLRRNGVYPDILTGDTVNGERKAIVERLNNGDVRVLIATGQLIGEGFDCKALTTLFLTTPIKFSGRVLQYVGRVLRPAPGKERATVYDYLDKCVPVLAASARARQRVYCHD